jgi:NAD(P)-dependent dehydrogenase (short-subunit alcohol dehydrogenase family)
MRPAGQVSRDGPWAGEIAMPLSSSMQALVKLVNFYARFTPSFTRVGYIARGLPLRPIRGDFAGQTWLVTGATGGLGRATTLEAVGRGALVLAVGRNPDALAHLAADADGAEGRVITVQCDLSNMAEVAALADRPELAGVSIDVLVNNVGVLKRSFAATAERFETSYATNLLGHFILTERLFEARKLSGEGAIINVVSGGLYNAPLNTAMLDIPEPKFNGFAAYGSHKRAQLALTDHWRQAFACRNLRTYAVHPGWADTAGVKTSLPKFRRVLAPILRNARQGVDTVIWLAAARPEEAVDQVWFDRKARSAHAYPHTRKAQASVTDLLARLARDGETVLGAPVAAAIAV